MRHICLLSSTSNHGLDQVPDSNEPPAINIKVTTERDDDVVSKIPVNHSTGSGDSFGSLL